MNEQILTPIATVAVGGLAYLGGRWQRSGRVASSDAETLWEQSQALITALMNRVGVLEAAVAGLSRDLGERDGRIEKLVGELAELRIEILQRDEQIARLEHERTRLAQRIAELERDLAHLRASDDEIAARARP